MEVGRPWIVASPSAGASKVTQFNYQKLLQNTQGSMGYQTNKGNSSLSLISNRSYPKSHSPLSTARGTTKDEYTHDDNRQHTDSSRKEKVVRYTSNDLRLLREGL
jgi:hypothetical protein